VRQNRKGLSIFIVTVLIASLGLGLWWNARSPKIYAKEVFLSTEERVQDKIANNQTYTILEIVSNVENARIGYLVGGSEPVINDADATKEEKLAKMYSLEAEGLLTRDLNGTVEYPMTYTVDDTGEDYIERQQDLIDAGYEETMTTVSGGDTYTVTDGNAGNGDITYHYEKGVFANNDFWKKYVLGMEADRLDSLHVSVVTKTADTVSTEDINGADLVYISGRGAVDYTAHDLTEAAAIRLADRITASIDYVPCVIDYSVYSAVETAVESNLYKLSLVLLSQDIDAAYAEVVAQDGWSASTTGEIWQPVKNGMVVANSGHFVRGNVYWYAFNAGGFIRPRGGNNYFVSGDLISYLTTNAISAGFAEVVEAIDAENYNNSVNNSDRESMDTGSISPALAVQYIMQYDKGDGILYKSELKVLELEPCKEYSFDTDAKKAAMIAKWLPGYVGNESAVSVTCMTTAEFVGHNENIAEQYDLIYIGSNVGYFNTTTVNVNYGTHIEQRTYRQYNDTDMTGIIYSHVGDEGRVPYWGLIYTDASSTNKVNYRFPGNDLTTYKLKELKDYLDCGSPVIVADDFFTYRGTSSVTPSGSFPTSINGGKAVYSVGGRYVYGILDTSSYLYQFVMYALTGQDADLRKSDWNWADRAYKNFFHQSGATKDNLLSYVNQQKLYLNLTARPTEYNYTTTGTYSHINPASVTYLQPSGDGNYYLNYEFSISSLGVTDVAGQNFVCDLYIDVNNDGKFSKKNEWMDSLVITEISTGQTVERDKLRAGVAYRLRRGLPVEYMGCIAWELECTATNNDKICASATGYTVVQYPQDGQTQGTVGKEKLKILQITSADTTADNGDNSYYTWNNLNLQNEQANTSGVWGELLNNVPDFELNIETISTYGNDGLIARFKKNNDYLKEYDMLIFGFGDGFSDIRYDKLLNAIEDYAVNGCVLFAHDNTFTPIGQLVDYYGYEGVGYQKLAQNEYDWRGRQTAISGQAFMDFTGRTDSAYNVVQPSDGTANDLGNIGSRYISLYVRRLAGMDAYGVTEKGKATSRNGESIKKGTAQWQELVNLGKDIAFKPNSYQEETVPNTQGATYAQMREGTVTRSNSGLFCFKPESTMWLGLHTASYETWIYNGRTLYFQGNPEPPTEVHKINDGMITNYPYKIPDTFLAAATHSQYWALDLETDADEDGESDLVVWYTINDITTTGNSYTDDISSLSPNDAKNNYYIYNMGNITYTGVGHRSAKYNEQEAKLFINTMVASYVASVKDPSVTIVEDGATNASKVENIQTPFWDSDLEVAASINGGVVPVYFRVADDNIVIGSKQIQLVEFTLDEEAIELVIYDNNDQIVESDKLVNGSTYHVNIPISKLIEKKGESYNEFSISIKTVWNKSGKTSEKGPVLDSVIISKVRMFDLD